jgi:hypothetical protein
MDRGGTVALDGQMRHPVAGEQDRSGQADQAAAHHENLSVTFWHACSISGRAGLAISGHTGPATSVRCACVIPSGRGRRAPGPGAAGSRGLH